MQYTTTHFKGILTTISPSPFIHRVQRTPKSVVISFCAGIVPHCIVLERNAATVARYCLLGADSWNHWMSKEISIKYLFPFT